MNEVQVYQTLINQWMEQYNTLHDILNCEQSALEKRDFAKLGSLTKEKLELVRQINQHQLPSIISTTAPTLPKINQVRVFCLNNDDLKPSWESLMELVDQCNFKNEVNARLINIVSKSTRRTFNLIKGFDPDNNIYNASGDSTLVKHFGVPLSA